MSCDGPTDHIFPWISSVYVDGIIEWWRLIPRLTNINVYFD